MNFFTNNIMMVMFLPLWVCCIILSGMFIRLVGNHKITFVLTVLATIANIIFSAGALHAITTPQQVVIEHSYEILTTGGFSLCTGCFLNTDSCILLLILMIIFLFTEFYTYSYMQNRKHFNLCFLGLNFLNFSLAGLVLSPNLIQFFIFQCISAVMIYVLSFLRKEDNGKFYLILNAAADAALLCGIVIFSYFSIQYMNFSPIEFLSFNNIENFKEAMDVLLYPNVYALIFMFYIVYFVIKMLIFPFNQWICSVNTNISPLSAITNSVFIVFSGIFLSLKLYPAIPQSMLTILIYAGIITAVISAFLLIAQKDIRKFLSYITSLQTGLIVMLLGLGAISSVIIASVIFIFTSVMFSLCITEIIELVQETDKEKITGIKKLDYSLAIYWLFSAFSFSGICFGGFTVKDSIIKVLKLTGYNHLFIPVLLVYFLASFAVFKLYFDIFEGDNNNFSQNKTKYKNFSYMALCLFIILPGFMYKISDTKLFISIIITSLVSILAIVLAAFIYKTKEYKSELFVNIANKELYIPDIFNIICKLSDVFFSIIRVIEKYIIDNTLKIMFIPFIYILKKASELKNVLLYKIWIFIYLIAVFYIAVYLYKNTGGI